MTKDEVRQALDEWAAALACIRAHVGPRVVWHEDGGHFWTESIPCPQCGRIRRP